AHAQAKGAARRVRLTEIGVREAVESANKNLAGVTQTRPAGGAIVLVIRPQEAVASVQALAQAYAAYFGAVADANRAQFRLYRSIGQPAQRVVQAEQTPTLSPTVMPPIVVRTSHVERNPASDGKPEGSIWQR